MIIQSFDGLFTRDKNFNKTIQCTLQTNYIALLKTKLPWLKNNNTGKSAFIINKEIPYSSD